MNPLPKPRRRPWPLRLSLVAAALAVVLGTRLWWIPLPRGLEALRHPRARRIEVVDRHGTPLRILPGADGRVGRELDENEIPAPLVLATLAAEDSRFFSHPGVDAAATLRAAGQWIRHRRVISGGSTLSQQLIKLAAPQPRTLRTKFIEAAQALRLEREWDKSTIMRAYLDEIDYGNHCAGLGEAALHYFGKHPGNLDLAESAFLAGLPQAPTRLNPRRSFNRAKTRQEWILGRCLKLGWISAAEHQIACAREIRLAPLQRGSGAPHFVQQVLARSPVTPELRPEAIQATTLDLPLQRRCEEIVTRQLASLRTAHVQDGALVVIENRTGNVLALVGSPDWFHAGRGQVNGTLARRSPGSALKPFTYLLAFSDGATAADIIPDIPTEFPTATGSFQPLNYDRRFRGPVSLREALASSLNVPAVRVLAHHGGPARLQQTLQSVGLTTLDRASDDYGLGLTLGSGEVRLLELANAYATLARLGQWLPVRLQTATPPPSPQPRLDPDACWLVADILADPIARATTFGLETPLRFDFPVACKTGTSSGFRDNWALGYTPEFTVGVWVGNFDGTPMAGVSGVAGAAPILQDVFTELHARSGTGWYPTPAHAQRFSIQPLNGHRFDHATRGPSDVFVGNHLTPRVTPLDFDALGRVRVSTEYGPWLASAANRLGPRLVADLVPDHAAHQPLQILKPQTGTVFFFDADLPESAQRIVLGASAACEWQCPTLKLEARAGRTEAYLKPGHHRLVAVDPARNHTAETWIEVQRY